MPKLMTNADLQPKEGMPRDVEMIADYVAVFGSACNGCQKTGTDVMLVGTVRSDPRREDDSSYVTLFLSKKEAKELYQKLRKVLSE
jgi:hypothetical protein